MAGTKSLLFKFGRQVQSLKIGYDQRQRWTWLDKKNRKILANREGDCSAITAGIVWLSGYPIDISGTCFTGNIDVLLKKAGWKAYKYTNKNAVKAGDVVLAKKHHVVLALSKTEWLSAEHDERGKESGGKAGDQTGKEVVIRAPYERLGGWDYILRPPADPVVDPAPEKTGVSITGSMLSAVLSATGAGNVRNEVRTRVTGDKVPTSLEELANMANHAFTGSKANKHGVSVFMATMLQESAWLQTTVEYGLDPKSYDPYRGRTFEQITGKANYAAFGAWCKAKGLVDNASYFVDNPELLGDLKWAWLGGIWYFSARGLWDEANAGDFQRVQTTVNLGSAKTNKVPAGWNARLNNYRAFLSVYAKPAAIPVSGKVDKKTIHRLQEVVGAEMNSALNAQTLYLLGIYLGLKHAFSLSNKDDVKALQKKVGIQGKDVDGVWWMAKSKAWGPQTTKAVQTYLNKLR